MKMNHYPETRPPNILWLMSDQHHAECWQGGGRADVITPNLNALADKGIVYERAYCNNPICGPSRACFLTGQYASNHGITGNCVQGFTGAADFNLGRHFRNAGYQTGIIGKAHLPEAWIQDGFEHQRLCDLADADPDNPRSVAYYDYLIQQGIADEYDLGSLPPGHRGSRMRAFTSAIPLEHSVEVWTGNEGVDFLEQRDQTRPFFLQLSFQRPHDPYAPSKESMDMYDPASLKLPDNAHERFLTKFAGKPEYQQAWIQSKIGGYPYVPENEDDLRRQLAHYYTLISVIDAQIGRVFSTLQKQGLEENTIVVYHADHGDFAGEHGLMLKNLGIYEAIHRIPFLLYYPGCQPNRNNSLIQSVDLFPTLCHLANLTIPEGLDGKVIVGQDTLDRNHVVCEWDWGSEPQRRTAAVRSKHHRLVYYRDTPEDGELYCLDEDPGELKNVYNNPEHRPIRDQLIFHLLNHLLSSNRRLDIPFDQALNKGPQPLSKRIHKCHLKWSDAIAELSEIK